MLDYITELVNAVRLHSGFSARYKVQYVTVQSKVDEYSVIQHSLLKYGKSISEVDDHPTIKIVLDVRQKNFGEFVVRNFSVAVAVSVDHRFVHDLLKLSLL